MALTPAQMFADLEPELTELEITAAAQTSKIVISFKGKPVVGPKGEIGYLAVKLVLADGSFSIILMDQLVARALEALVQAANSANWDASGVTPRPVRH